MTQKYISIRKLKLDLSNSLLEQDFNKIDADSLSINIVTQFTKLLDTTIKIESATIDLIRIKDAIENTALKYLNM